MCARIQCAGDAQAWRAILFCGQGNALNTAYCGGKFRAEWGAGEIQIICGLETYVWPDSSH